MIPIGVITNIGTKIAEYFGLIEGVSTQVSKLVHQAFKSAKDNLEYAKTASGQNQIDYIKRAKDRFIDAVAVEANENKILALAGLSMCQHLLGDTDGAQRSLDRVHDVELTRAEITKYTVAHVARYTPGITGLISNLYLLGLDFPSLEARVNHFEKTKKDAINTSRRLLS